jgi:penicillin-binding protein 1A
MAKRRYYRNTFQKGKKRRRLFFVLKIFGLGLSFFVLFSLIVFIYYAKDLPRPEKFTERQIAQPTKIYDRSGQVVLYEIYGEEKRTIVSLEVVPEYLKQAIIVTEDSNFYHHFGIDFKGILRSILLNIKIGQPIYGGSTIPQQLIRSTFLSSKKTAERKIREIILTLELDRRYSKDQILEWYLNQIPFGQNSYGVEAASQAYFKKPVSDLTLAEAAILAALIQAPSYLSPYGDHQDKLLARKDYVIEQMEKKGVIDQKQAETAKNEEIKFAKISQPIKAPHFTLWVKQYLDDKYGEDFLKERGLKVYTTLDWELQEFAEKIVEEGVEKNKIYNSYNASLVAIDPKTGQILVMIGSADYFGDPYPKNCIPGKNCLFDPQFNVALGTKNNPGRQPGSAFKPFAYLVAFKKGYTPNTLLWDVETNFGKWGEKDYIPQNYDNQFRGQVTFRQALSQSINVPSVKVLYLAGIEKTIETAKTLGITTLNEDSSFYGLSLVLGGGEVKLLDITSAYGVFATEGFSVTPTAILKIEDNQGNIIEENKKTPKRVFETEPCRLINDILSDNEARAPLYGPQSSLYFKDYQVAAKTGTTQYYNNFWIVGYTPSIVTGIWAGNNDNSSMSKVPGIRLTGPIWHQFMEKALLKYPKEYFNEPELISTQKPVLNGTSTEPHTILQYVNKDDPQGPPPEKPELDSQYNNWEKGIQNWLASH